MSAEAPAEKEAALEVAATEAQAAGLDAVQITALAVALPNEEPVPVGEAKPL